MTKGKLWVIYYAMSFGSPERIARKRDKVVVVDDDDTILEMLEINQRLFYRHRARTCSSKLVPQSYEIVTFPNPVEALAYFQDHHLNVVGVWSDHGMPQMNGFEFASQVKEKYPGTPFVMVAGGKDIDRQTAQELGIHIVGGKPFDLSETTIISVAFPLVRRYLRGEQVTSLRLLRALTRKSPLRIMLG